MDEQQLREMFSIMKDLVHEVTNGFGALMVAVAGGLFVFIVLSKMIYDELRGIRLALEQQNRDRQSREGK